MQTCNSSRSWRPRCRTLAAGNSPDASLDRKFVEASGSGTRKTSGCQKKVLPAIQWLPPTLTADIPPGMGWHDPELPEPLGEGRGELASLFTGQWRSTGGCRSATRIPEEPKKHQRFAPPGFRVRSRIRRVRPNRIGRGDPMWLRRSASPSSGFHKLKQSRYVWFVNHELNRGVVDVLDADSRFRIVRHSDTAQAY